MSKAGAAVGILALGVLFALLQPHPACAQETDTERARSEFKLGVAKLKQDDWAGAEQHLRTALSLRESPVIAHNLALALAQGGQVIEALSLLEGVLADPKSKEGLIAQARSLREETTPRLAYIELNVKGDTEGVLIKFDDKVVDDAALREPVAADPGQHAFVAYRQDEEITRAGVRLTEGSTVSLDLNLPSAAQPEPNPTPAPIAPTPEQTARASSDAGPDPAHTEADGGLLENPWFWAGTGAVVVGVIITIVVLAADDDGADREPTEGSLGTIPIGE